jgi:MATE family multidrug resistance protein
MTTNENKPDQTVAASGEAGSPFRELAMLALPTVVTMTSYTVMQSVDKLMVSRLGPDPLYVGAQGNGGLAAFVPISIAMGCLTVVNTYVSQHLGAGSSKKAPAYAWNGLWIALAWWLVLIPYGLMMPAMFGAFWGGAGSDEADVARRVAMSCAYGQPLVFGAILTMAARCLAQFFYGMHKPYVVLTASLSGNVVNFFANSVLIYGPEPLVTGTWLDQFYEACASVAQALGVARMGVSGAAYGTLLGTCVELVLPAVVFLSAKYNKEFGTRGTWRPSKERIKELLKLGWPGGAMFGNEMVCWAMFMVVFVGSFGADHSTAGWIAHQWMSLSFMPAVGISVAMTAMVGKCMGMGRPDLAVRRAWAGVFIALAYMGTMGVLFVVFRKQMVGLFIDDATDAATTARLLALGGGFMIATACFQLFDAVAMTLSGALRGAGDTMWPAIVTLVLSWTIIVLGGYAMIKLAPSLESLGPWIAAAAYICILSLAILARFMSGKWKSIKLVEKSDGMHA